MSRSYWPARPITRSPGLARSIRRGLPVRNLLLLDEGNCLRDQALATCGASHAGRHATSLETLRSMVAAGGGYTLLPRLAARDEEGGLVVCRSFAGNEYGRVIALVWRSSDPRSDELERLADFFRDHAPEGTLVVG